MRQAGRYMSEFRAYSDRFPFRKRSETPAIAVELSLQPYRAFHTDAVIMFSDILTPLPALGIEFDIAPGKGPFISQPIRDMDRVKDLEGVLFEPENDLTFVAEVLEKLRAELQGGDAALIGFVGAPFTLAAYSIEGAAAKYLVHSKAMMYGQHEEQRVLERVLERFAGMIAQYALFQIDHGAQVVQFFDSWAHHLSPDQYKQYALPYVKRAMQLVKRERPDIPLIFFANGAGGKLEMIGEVLNGVVDVIGVDWGIRMEDARRRLGDGVVLQGNVDPSILAVGTEAAIRGAVRDTVKQAGGKVILNLGHGVIKETPEEAVRVFCDEARRLSMAELS
eukprot:GFKZ01003610.1.p1 GENE.GFKZ01003610.1~~GFKZ01003610.1.p1  ORF type:complete len:335 (-),score=74.03 GFKZ01003610.1:1277-2281(-)